MVNRRKRARQNKNKNPQQANFNPLQARQESTAGKRFNPQPAKTRIHSQLNLEKIDATYLGTSCCYSIACRGLQIVESQVTHTANAEVLQWWKPSTKQDSINFRQSNLCRGLQIAESQVTHTANAEVLQWWKPSTKQDSINFRQSKPLQRSSDSRITGDTYSQC